MPTVMPLRNWLILLTALALLFGLAAAALAWLATLVKNKPHPIYDMLSNSRAPADTAGDALTYSLRATLRADATEQDVAETSRLNRLATLCTIASVIFSAIAGFMSALAS
jgi:hypothetical protein